MPVGVPPKGGPLGRSRSRLSASGLTTYLRCPRQWYLTRKVGLSSPSSIGQVTGLVIEDALCRVLMPELYAGSLRRVFDAGRLVSDLLNMRPEFFGKVINGAFHGRCRHIKLRPPDALIGLDIAELFKTLQRCAHRAIGAACNLNNVFGDRCAALGVIRQNHKQHDPVFVMRRDGVEHLIAEAVSV